MNLGRTYSNLDQEAIETTQVVKGGENSKEHKEEIIGENREAESETKSRNEKEAESTDQQRIFYNPYTRRVEKKPHNNNNSLIYYV